MNAALPLALLCGISLASAALSFLTLARLRGVAAGRKPHAQSAQLAASVEAIGKAVESLSEEVREMRRQAPAATPGAGAPGPGLNLSKRSQALRMHRRGEPPEQIAANLAISRQEVDLLLKIHRIVMTRC